MIAKQRAVHGRVWGVIGLVLLVGVVLSVLVRRGEAENAGELPGLKPVAGKVIQATP